LPDFDPDAYLAANATQAKGFDPDAYLAANGEATGGMTQGAPYTRGILDMVPMGHKIIAAGNSIDGYVHGADIGDEYQKQLAAVDQLYAKELKDNPGKFRAGQATGLVGTALLAPEGLGASSAYGAAVGAGDARGDFTDTLKAAGIGGVLGAGSHEAMAGAGSVASALTSKAASSALPWLQRLEQKFGTKVMDASVKPAESTLRSATGTLGALSREGSTTMRDLADGMRPGSPLSELEQRMNKASLATPDAQGLASDLAGKARARLPGQMDSIKNGRALVEQAAQDVSDAKTPEALAATEQRMRSYANDTLLKRYLLPAAAGAVTGGLLGGDEHGSLGAVAGLGVGLGGRPMLRAIMRQASNPGYAAPASRAAVSLAEKMAQISKTQPELLGKFSAPLTQASARGSDALAATHFTLNQDPAYQELTHKLAEGE
jgi:hypothetical protein